MIEIFLLEQLVSFAKHGKLVLAAEELHISQPALSRSMKKLEEELGVPLFHRENSRITLNETGRLAAECAEKVLAADREMIESVLGFDRRQRTVSVGACAPFPMQELMPILQDAFVGMTISSEMADDNTLIAGLKSRLYQLVILHDKPDSAEFFCQRFLDERLFVTVTENHPLALKSSVTFGELSQFKLLVGASVGFWMDVVKRELPKESLLVQSSMEALGELIVASSLPFFNSDRMLERRRVSEGRISIPISDETAHAVYYIACLSDERRRFDSVFSAVRQSVLSVTD